MSRYFLLGALFFTVTTFAMSPEAALKRLKEGNKRYVGDQLEHPDRSPLRREEVKAGQNPFATIVGCSDSRVSPEIIFDQGLGDLFIVRVAGNVIGPVERDSIDYSARYLGSSLVLVMGHESCGAVTAVFQGKTADIEEVAALIEPAIKDAKNVDEAIKDNIRWMVNYLKNTDYIQKLISQKKIDVIGAYYHLGSGKVEILK